MITANLMLQASPFIFIAGDARNEVLTTSELAKMKFDPNHYRVNAYQGMAYDPMRKNNKRLWS